MLYVTDIGYHVILRCAVTGVPTQDLLPQLGATVVYTVDVMNGKKDITAASIFTLTLPTGPVGLTCKNPATTTVVSGQALPANLVANTKITCSFNMIVTTAHQLAGEIAPLTVAASFTGADGLYVAPLTTAAVPVAAGALAGPPTITFPSADASNSIAGK
jgi:hypothetical protein